MISSSLTSASSPSAPASSSSATVASVLPHQPDGALLESFRYVNSMPGKNVRGKMIDCFQTWLQIDDGEGRSSSGGSSSSSQNNTKDNSSTSTSKRTTNTRNSSQTTDILDTVKAIIGDLHNASLMIDDIEDQSTLRRGIPVTHAIFGIATTINTANYAYFLALEKCHALPATGRTRALEVFVGEMLNLHRGQGHDILWREHHTCPTEAQYVTMVRDKTGGLFRLAVGMMQAFATQNKHTDYTALVNNLAVYFQIRDDYLNIIDAAYMHSKSFCEDITEGKFSFPILHCIRHQQQQEQQPPPPQTGTSNTNTTTTTRPTTMPDVDTRLLSILKQRTDDLAIKRYAQAMMVDAGSLEYARQKCAHLKHDIVEEVQRLGGNPALLALVNVLDVPLGAAPPTTPPTHNNNEQHRPNSRHHDIRTQGGRGGPQSGKGRNHAAPGRGPGSHQHIICNPPVRTAGSLPPGLAQPQSSSPPPRPAPKGALTASALASAAPEVQKNMLGERLYPRIHQSQPDLAGKITGMLLELDNSELLHLLESPAALKAKIEEAIQVLTNDTR